MSAVQMTGVDHAVSPLLCGGGIRLRGMIRVREWYSVALRYRYIHQAAHSSYADAVWVILTNSSPLYIVMPVISWT